MMLKVTTTHVSGAEDELRAIPALATISLPKVFVYDTVTGIYHMLSEYVQPPLRIMTSRDGRSMLHGWCPKRENKHVWILILPNRKGEPRLRIMPQTDLNDEKDARTYEGWKNDRFVLVMPALPTLKDTVH